jgi:hypothetical protein
MINDLGKHHQPRYPDVWHAQEGLDMRILRALLNSIFGRAGLPARDTTVMANPTDQEFAAVIVAIANFRKGDRSMAVDVTSFFQPMLNHLSMTELAEYLLSRYPNARGEDSESKHDLVDIRARELKSFSRGFKYQDRLHFTIAYCDDWRTANRFLAVLVNDLV